MAGVDGLGRGMLHATDSEMAYGRKYWVWGRDVHDVARMEFLSSPGHGDYIEMQAGVRTPTQAQTFGLGPGEAMEFTEAILPIDIGQRSANKPYAEAIAAAQPSVPSRDVYNDIDSFLSSVADK